MFRNIYINNLLISHLIFFFILKAQAYFRLQLRFTYSTLH